MGPWTARTVVLKEVKNLLSVGEALRVARPEQAKGSA